MMKPWQTTITADRAADIAQHIRDEVSDCYQHGTLNEFARGMFQGQLIIVQCYMPIEEWILQGSQNEINFYCRRAKQDEMRLP